MGIDTFNFAYDANDILQSAESDSERVKDNNDGRLKCGSSKCRIHIGRENWKTASVTLISKKLATSNAYVALGLDGEDGNHYHLPKYSTSSRYFEAGGATRDCKFVAAQYAWYDWPTGKYERTHYQVKPTDRVSIRTWFDTYVDANRDSPVRHAEMDADEGTSMRIVPANGSDCAGHNRTVRIYAGSNGDVLQSVESGGLGGFADQRDVVAIDEDGPYADSEAQLFDVYIPRVNAHPSSNNCLHHGDEFSLISHEGDWVWASNAGDIRNLSSNDTAKRTSFWAVYLGQ